MVILRGSFTECRMRDLGESLSVAEPRPGVADQRLEESVSDRV